MQLMFIFGIVFAIGAVMFALQNSMPVTVTVALWHYDSSLTVVLLLAVALGAIIAGLVSSPTMIKGQWTGARLRRQVTHLEEENTALQQRIGEQNVVLARLDPEPRAAPEAPKAYAGMKELLAAGMEEKPVA